MSIDGIGKGGPKLPSGGPEGAAKPGKAFEVSRPEKAGPVDATSEATAARASAEVQGASGASPLARLRAGQIDLNQYLDLKVDEATASLSGLPAGDRDAIKKMLRDQLATDPTLVDLVKSATGAAPSIDE